MKMISKNNNEKIYRRRIPYAETICIYDTLFD